MEIVFRAENNTLIVVIDGEIDHHTSVEARQRIDKEIDKNLIKNVIFDFHKVKFMDSSGVGVMIGRYKKLQKIGGNVGIVNLSPQIMRVFEISGLFKIIPYYDNTQQAINEM